jgi:aminoglycoside phosphotransferase (APT) family kinase protein
VCCDLAMGRHGVRAGWDAVPVSVREQIDIVVGDEVTSATNLDGGFSPGLAARCELSGGRSVFVKAAGLDLNPMTPTMHRREGEVLRSLPAGAPAPRLLGVVDDGDWVALVIEWVEGRMPVAPLDGHDVGRLLRLAERLAETHATDDVAIDNDLGGSSLRPIMEAHPDLSGHWRRLVDEPLDGLDEWSRRRLDEFADLERDVASAVDGDRLVHLDLRTDNVIFSNTGEEFDVIVDWPGASTGAAWVDLVGLLPSLELDGGPPCAEVFAASLVARSADPDAVDAFVATIAGYFTRQSLLASPVGLPTLRSFQAAQGRVARRWLGERRGWALPPSEWIGR